MSSNFDEKKDTSRSWFCVFNNPEEHGFCGTEQEICDNFVDAWVSGCPTRSCAVTYCVSADGLKHLHAVLEDSKTMRFSAVKKVFPSMHIEPTRGNKEQAENYINKRGRFEEKGEQVIATARFGEIKACQGQRRDFEVIEEFINQGLTPNQIMDKSLSFRRYEKLIKDAYYSKRYAETPVRRDVKVYWHVGKTRTGKTYTYVNLCKAYGEDDVYFVNDYGKGGFDKYNGERFVVFDEFRGQMPYFQLLNLLDCYKAQIPCRFTNCYALWSEVHITTVLPPEDVYRDMVERSSSNDSLKQLYERINVVVYHYKENGEFKTFELPMSQYTNYDDLKALATSDSNGFSPVPEDSVPDNFKQAEVDDFMDVSNYNGIAFD